jgi:flagellar motor switch protein FliN/FliY
VTDAAELRRWLNEEFSSRLATVFETMAGERPAIEMEEIAEIPAEAALRWQQPFSNIPGIFWVAAAEQGWSLAGGHVLQAAGIEERDPVSLKSTYLETVDQALSGIASAIGGRVGREVTCSGGKEWTDAELPSGSEITWAVLHVHLAAETANIAIGIESALLTAMVSASQAEANAPAKIAEAAAAAVAAGGFTAPVNSRTFELLLDVELPVSVSFGRAQVPLKDVLKLTTGSIVELNRSILEPVEVIVNNCVIARGEVVVVEGNFGVRVHQVISRQERLRTLN